MSDDHGAGRRRGVGDVAAELAALRRDLTRLDGIARESAGLLAETAPRVLDLEEQVAALRGTLTALTARDEPDPARDEALAALGLCPDPPGPWCWPTFDAEQAAAAWQALACWVGEVLVPTYRLTRGQLLDCWPHHPRMVTELSWLRNSYLDAHAPRTAPGKAADWHLRALPGALAALADAVPSSPTRRSRPRCAPGRHHRDTRLDEADDDPGLVHQVAAGEHWRLAWHEARDCDLAGRR